MDLNSLIAMLERTIEVSEVTKQRVGSVHVDTLRDILRELRDIQSINRVLDGGITDGR